jgi:hypothetical protein
LVTELTGKSSGTASKTGSLEASSTKMSCAFRGAASVSEFKKYGK